MRAARRTRGRSSCARRCGTRPALLLDDEQQHVHVAVVVGVADVLAVARRLALAPVLLAAAAPEPGAPRLRACARAPRGSSTPPSAPGRCRAPGRSPGPARRRRSATASISLGGIRDRRGGRRDIERSIVPVASCHESGPFQTRRSMACADAAERAARRPHVLSLHGDDRVDDWYWLRERDDPDVLAHLEAENAYTEAVLAPTAALRDASSRRSAAGFRRPTRPRRSRRRRGSTTRAPSRAGSTRSTAAAARGDRRRRDEQVLLDENELAAGHDYFALGGFEISPDHRLARVLHRRERRRALHAALPRPRARPRPPDDVVETSLRPRVGRRRAHRLLRPARRRHAPERRSGATRSGRRRATTCWCSRKTTSDSSLGVGRTRTGRFVLIDAASKLTSETWFIPTADARRRRASSRRASTARVRRSSTTSHRASTATASSIVTNSGGARELPARRGARRRPGRANWVEVVAHRDDVRLDAVDAFRDHLVAQRTHRRARPHTACTDFDAGASHDAAGPIPCTACGSAPTSSSRRGDAALRLHVIGRAGDRLRLRRRRPRTAPSSRSNPCSAATTRRSIRRRGSGRPRPTARGSRSRSCTAGCRARRAGAGIAGRLRRRTSIDRSRVPRRPAVAARPGLRLRDRARTRWRRARPRRGTRTAASSTSRTRSPTSSPAPKRSSRATTRRRVASSRAAAARAVC